MPSYGGEVEMAADEGQAEDKNGLQNEDAKNRR